MDTGTMINRTNQYFKSDIPFENPPLKVIKFQLDRAPERSGEMHYMLFDPGVGQCR